MTNSVEVVVGGRVYWLSVSFRDQEWNGFKAGWYSDAVINGCTVELSSGHHTPAAAMTAGRLMLESAEASNGCIMGEGAYFEGRSGHYCSETCRDESKGWVSDAAERSHERRQLGVDHG